MDPTACLERIGAPGRITRDVRDAVQDLIRWLDGGGFAPDWRTSELGTKRFRRYAPSTFKRYCAALLAPADGADAPCGTEGCNADDHARFPVAK